MSDFRTPMSRVRGHGAAKAGTGDFIGERVSGILLTLLVPYLFISAALQVGPDYASALAWVEQPIVAAPFFVFLLTSVYHMHLGMRVVIEDYVESRGARAFWLLINAFVCLAVATAGGFALLRLSMGA